MNPYLGLALAVAFLVGLIHLMVTVAGMIYDRGFYDGYQAGREIYHCEENEIDRHDHQGSL